LDDLNLRGKSMFFDKIYGSWEDIQKKKYEKMMQIMPDLAGKKILDIGIGSGYFEGFLKANGIDADIIGVDVSKEMHEGSVRADGDELPFVDSSFDMVICLDTIHLIITDDFRRVLRKDGLVLFSIFFNKQNFDEKRDMIKNRLSGFMVVNELTIEGKENEYVVIATKK